jgi:nucleoid DNA-binding protein
MTKTELERAVADAAGVEKRTAAAVLDALEEVVTKNVRKGEAVTIRPGFIKVSRKDVKARKAREGTNPFTGEPTTFKARPASKTAKLTALKKLKDGVGTKRGPGRRRRSSQSVARRASSPASVRRYAYVLTPSRANRPVRRST